MLHRTRHALLLGAAAALAGVLTLPGRAPLAQVALPPEEQLCAQEAVPSRAEGTELSTLTSAGLEGVVYDPVAGTLELERASGQLTAENMSAEDVFIACSGDFDEDGWVDFVAADYSGPDHAGVGSLRLFRNLTISIPEPDWNNPSSTRDPAFSVSNTIEAAWPEQGVGAMACGDIDGDGNLDFLLMRCNYGQSCADPTRAVAFLGDGAGGFDAPYQFLDSLTIAGYIAGEGNRMALHDLNDDGRLDLVIGTGGTTAGVITAYYNDGATPPKFVTPATLVSSAGPGFPSAGVSALTIADFTSDGKPDLVYGTSDTTTLTLIPGTDTGLDGTAQVITYGGYAVQVYAADMSGTGRPDLVVVADELRVYGFVNDGDSQPFSSGAVGTVNPGGGAGNTLDVGLVFDYDNDPADTPDLFLTNADVESETWMYANRPGSTFVDCGRATSGVIPTPELDAVDGLVTAVRLSPEPAAPDDGSWTFEASNDNGVTWHPAPPCADDPTDFCADVSSTTGRDVRWRVTMCSNTGGASPNTAAPEMTAVETRYTYVLARTHFRAGPVMRDDIIYVGAVREPGHEGRFLAIDNATGTVLWDAADKLDAMTEDQRHIFSHRASGVRVDLQLLTLLDMIDVLNVVDLLQGGDLVDWLTSKRFGTASPRTMGGVINSTAAVLSRPGRPYYFDLASTPESEKTLIQDHVDTFAARQNLVFVGSQTGMLHAFYTDPLNPADAKNGSEAWAWVPYNVARRLLGDKTDGEVTAFVDGSPTLATAKISGAYRSVLVMGEGTGGDSVYALDVTETIDPLSGSVLGPTFLWSFTDGNMGDTISKPAVIRTLISGTETWLAVFASGPDSTGDKGDSLYAVNIETGNLLWRFDIGDSDTYISTDITATDEENAEPDGYISRLYFGDSKGRVWKLDPTVFSSGVASPVGSTVNVGLGASALFSTQLTADALGAERAISANIIAVPDALDRTILYFGTGGTAETAAGETNAFYAVFADSGEIRNKIDITGARYNGASFQDGQIIFTRSEIPETAGPCVVSDSEVVAIDPNTFALQFFQEFEGRIASPVYISGGEFFAVTVTGTLVASQYTGNNVATAPAYGPPEPEASPPDVVGNIQGDRFQILGWRQTY